GHPRHDLIDSFVAWLTGLPPALVYLTIAAATFLENFLPPVPSDVAVALGGFLTQQGTVHPVGVWASALAANLLATVTLYFLVCRVGRSFLDGSLGKRLISPRAISGLERAYLRLGLVGIFIGRLLPMFRAFVAPFAALVGLKPARALIPM